MKNFVKEIENQFFESPRKPLAEKHSLYRIALVRYVDSLFYEAGDVRWCHSRCYWLIIRDLWGIGENTFRHYLHYPAERLTEIVIPQRLKELLRLYVSLVKKLTASQSADFLSELHRLIEAAFDDLRRQGVTPDVARLIEELKKQ